jgi:hypothetical protein
MYHTNKTFLFTLLMLGAVALPRSMQAAVTVSPTAITLAAGQSLNLNIAGATAQGVKWTVSPAVGTLTGSLTSAVYAAPAAVTQSQAVTITATTVATPATSVKTVVTLAPAVTVTVSPASLDMMPNSQQTFSAAVAAAQNTAVTWSASLGSISSAGAYVAPMVNADTTATITATSQAAPAKTASATIRLHPNQGIWFTTQANGLQSVMFNGVNYNYLYGETLVTAVTLATPNGNVRINTVCTGSFNAATVTKHCPTSGGDSVDVSVTFSASVAGPGVSTAPGTNTGTIRADVQITNNSASTAVTQAMLSILGVSMVQYNAAASHAIALDATNPVSTVNYQTGEFAIWNNAPSSDVTMNMSCGWSYICKHQPLINNIAPAQTKTASFSLRFTNDVTAPAIGLAPEAYSDYAASYPTVVNSPDRRPLVAWFMADHSHQSATNPRGYFNDPTINASNISAFGARAMSQAQSILTQIKARPVQPQGILLWDLEGQEFMQPTTYIGDPRVLSQGYAPEMNATADAIFALFRNSGLKVGLTLRPQSMQWGTALPANCTYNSDNNYKDYYVRVDQPLGQKFYGCYDPNGAGWSLIPNANGFQTSFTSAQVAQVTSLLMSKVAYAHSRWGATLYYVDSTVWVGGAPLPQDIFRALQVAFPDCLFIPEENNAATMGVAMPYSEPKNTAAPKFAPESWRYIYPTGGLGIYLSNCVGDTTCWNNNAASFDIGQKVGDMAIYAVPSQMSPAQYSTIESMIMQARIEAGSITVTDSSSGSHFSYTGSPSTVYQYPVKMRVYFAPSAAAMPASTTYCESGGWMGENTCTLNLAGLATAQVRYYDFNGHLVISESAGAR